MQLKKKVVFMSGVMFVPRTHTCKHVERRNVATRWPTEAAPARQLHVCITAALGTPLHTSTTHVETKPTPSCTPGPVARSPAGRMDP